MGGHESPSARALSQDEVVVKPSVLRIWVRSFIVLFGVIHDVHNPEISFNSSWTMRGIVLGQNSRIDIVRVVECSQLVH